jgi:hypothetical protein
MAFRAPGDQEQAGLPLVEEKPQMNKPCPFCGDQFAVTDTLISAGGKPGRFRVQCRDCGGATKWHDTEEQAWAAWDNRHVKLSPELAVFIFNANAFAYEGRLYIRNEQSGFCYAQKEFRGSLKRIGKKDFLSAAQKAAIAQAERVNTECEKTAGKVQA